MKILYVTSEAHPFIKTGGLADVAGSLPKALKKKRQDIRVVLPLYSQIPKVYRDKMNYIGYYYVDIAWKHRYVGVFELEHDGVIYYFLDNESYFYRNNIYGEFDDAERFIFFSKAVVVLPKYLDFKVDVIHANDWHSGLVPVYVNDFRNGDDFYKDVRTVYTIHNLKYQGIFGRDAFYITGLPSGYMNFNDLEFHDAISFMKAGIVHSTKFNTVSQTYAKEITTEFFGEGLQDVINFHSDKLSGIVNGIDYDIWNPKKDKIINTRYDIKSLSKKVKNKTALQREYGLPEREDVVMIGMVTRLTSMKGIDLIRHILEELLHEDIQFVVLGTGVVEYEEMFKYFEYKYPDKMAARMYFSSDESNKIYAASDLYMMPSLAEPCGISQLIAMRYGTLPIVRETGGLSDTVIPFNRFTNEGTGFTFSNINAHELLFKTQEAIRLYYDDKEIFNKLIENAMTSVFNWRKSSKEYLELYRSLR